MLRRLLNTLRRREPDEADLEARLARLEEEAVAPAMDFRAAIYGRAGDLCMEAGQLERALPYYGKAVDNYLGAGYYDSAISMCRKVIEVAPNVVRTRCTLAFLLIGEDLPYIRTRGLSEQAREQLQAYVVAAKASGREKLAAERLRMMAEVTDLADIRRLIADLLVELGATDQAAQLHATVSDETATPPAGNARNPGNQRDRWAEMLRREIMDLPTRPIPRH